MTSGLQPTDLFGGGVKMM